MPHTYVRVKIACCMTNLISVLRTFKNWIKIRNGVVYFIPQLPWIVKSCFFVYVFRTYYVTLTHHWDEEEDCHTSTCFAFSKLNQPGFEILEQCFIVFAGCVKKFPCPKVYKPLSFNSSARVLTPSGRPARWPAYITSCCRPRCMGYRPVIRAALEGLHIGCT